MKMIHDKNAAASSGVTREQALEALDELEASARGDEPFNYFAAPLIRQFIEQSAAPEAVVPICEDPTDPGFDVDVLRNHVRILERRVRDLHAQRNEARIDADKLQREIEDCPELNLSNYDAVDVERLNDWAIRADAEIERLRDARHAAAELVSLCATSKDGEQPTERRSITVSVGELRASDGTTYCVSLYKPGDNIGEGMCVLNTPNRPNAEDEAQAWREWLGIAGVPQCPKGKGDCAKVLPDKRCFDCPYGVPTDAAGTRRRTVARLGFDKVLHMLRNPHGFKEAELRAARLEAADRMEELQDAYLNMREWAEQNGLDTMARGNAGCTSGVGDKT